MRRYKMTELKITPYKKDENKEAKYEKFVEIKCGAPKPQNNAETIQKTTFVPISSVAVTGAEDPRGMTEEARQWFREVHRKEDAEQDFWGKAPVTKKMWNDPDVPDSAFAADHNIAKAARVDRWK